MSNNGHAKRVMQRKAIRIMFVNLCEQYAQMGEQLKRISDVLSPLLGDEAEALQTPRITTKEMDEDCYHD